MLQKSTVSRSEASMGVHTAHLTLTVVLAAVLTIPMQLAVHK